MNSRMFKIALYLIVFPLVLLSSPQDEVTQLKWAGPPGSRPEGFREWIEEHPYSEEIRIETTGTYEINGRAK